MYSCCYCALPDAAERATWRVDMAGQRQRTQHYLSVEQKDHNYDLEEHSFDILGRKGAFDMVKALEPEERVCHRVEKTYET